jgi:hypothetical protein
LGIAGIGCAELGLLFLVMGGLHPYTWGLPPQWLPAKWNPCPQDYRDYFSYGQNVSHKLSGVGIVLGVFRVNNEHGIAFRIRPESIKPMGFVPTGGPMVWVWHRAVGAVQ